jgi:R3H domain
MQVERAEKKAAKQAVKADKKASRLGPALLQLPAAITPSQRARIHAAANFAGMLHKSSGEGDERVLSVGDETAELV